MQGKHISKLITCACCRTNRSAQQQATDSAPSSLGRSRKKYTLARPRQPDGRINTSLPQKTSPAGHTHKKKSQPRPVTWKCVCVCVCSICWHCLLRSIKGGNGAITPRAQTASNSRRARNLPLPIERKSIENSTSHRKWAIRYHVPDRERGRIMKNSLQPIRGHDFMGKVPTSAPSRKNSGNEI